MDCATTALGGKLCKMDALLQISAISIGLGVFISGLIAKEIGTQKQADQQLIFEANCRASKWDVLNSLDALVQVPRTASNYPLSRYWLCLQEMDYQRGSISATLEFVEKLVRQPGIFKKAKSRALLKKYGFVWVLEEVLIANKVELAVCLYWKDLSSERDTKVSLHSVSEKKSQFEEQILGYLIGQTREIINRLNLNASIHAQGAPISGPPPVPNANAGNWVGPPPSAMPGQPPPSKKGKSVSSPGAGGSSLKGSLSAHRGASKVSFKEMSRSASLSTEEHTRRLVEWPTPQDYHEAVQNPFICFDSEDLKRGAAETDMLGMPKVSSGAFASVYRICSKTGDRAVRCFLHPIKDQQFRYKVLSSYVNPSQLPWTVGFEYLPEGIKIDNKWYPILTMDWVEGIPLNIYVASLCAENDREGLERLRNRFSRMCDGLRIANVAHGDLQHGNILVRNNELVLVDYDGMYVPGLKEKASNELGHPNYQHPERSEKDFNELIDHFSEWVIDTALLCLKEDPSLWNLNYDDGESMLLHRQDFLYPDRSPLLAQLAAHNSSEIRERVELFRSFLVRSIFEIPPLNGSLAAGVTAERKRIVAQAPVEPQPPEPRPAGPGLPDWLSDVD